jgi:ParB/RepB/Spo0J family partition protein
MTTAVKSKPAAPPAAVTPPSKPAALIQEGLILIDRIDVVSNVRKKFDETAIKELADSIRSKGLINSITLRPAKKDGRYELVAGERRYRAAKAAGLKEIPARVLDLDDEAAKLYQVDENLHRKDLTPIEEARGFQLLTQPSKDGKTAAKYTVDQVSKLVDKSEGYVYRAMALLELPKETIAAIEDGVLTPAHGHQILRVAPDRRKDLTLEVIRDGNTAADIKAWISRDVGGDLSRAKFPKDKPYAGEIACSACPFNSGNQGMLFDGAEKGRCTNGTCYGKKTEEAHAEYVAKIKAKYADAKEITVNDRNYYVGTGATDKGWICTGELKGNPPKEYRLTINPDDSLQLWVPKRAEKKKTQAQARPVQPKADPKKEFLAEQERIETIRILSLKTNVLTREAAMLMAAALLDFGVNDDVLKALEIDLNKVNTEKMSLEQLTQLVILGTVISEYDNGASDRQLKGFKLDVSKVHAEAKKRAQVVWDSSWGLKHRSVANSGSETACGISGLNYKTPTEKGIAVVDEKAVTCPDCKKAKK